MALEFEIRTVIFLPLPANNDLVRLELKNAGFPREHISLIVDKAGAPIAPGGLIVP